MIKFYYLLCLFILQSGQILGEYGCSSNEYPDGSGNIAIGDHYYYRTKLILFTDSKFELHEQNGGLYTKTPRQLHIYSGNFNVIDSTLYLNSNVSTFLNLNKEFISDTVSHQFTYQIKKYQFCKQGRCLSRWKGKSIAQFLK